MFLFYKEHRKTGKFAGNHFNKKYQAGSEVHAPLPCGIEVSAMLPIARVWRCLPCSPLLRGRGALRNRWWKVSKEPVVRESVTSRMFGAPDWAVFTKGICFCPACCALSSSLPTSTEIRPKSAYPWWCYRLCFLGKWHSRGRSTFSGDRLIQC